jgi:ABC-type transport system involved in multi-copper enzyme maturation permease subunit
MNMMSIPQILSVCAFELRRSLTVGRIFAFLVLSLFPPAMVLLISRVSPHLEHQFLIMLLTYIVSILALLLWATPNVYAELESRNWLFLTTRPRGRTSLLFGKYLAAGISGTAVGFIALSLSVLVIATTVGRFRSDVLSELVHFWSRFSIITLIANFEYAAVFSLIGVLFQRKAMIVATIYAMGFELLFAIVPALITKFSVRYHLLGLSLAWVGWFFPGEKWDQELYEMWLADLPLWANILVLGSLPFFVLAAAAYIIRVREYITVDEI